MVEKWQYIIPSGVSQVQHLDEIREYPKEAYIYQNVHTLGYACRNIERHVEILQDLTLQLFDKDISLSAKTLADEVAVLLERERITRKNSVKVVLKCNASGHLFIKVCPPSLYRGYVVRSLRPDLVSMRMPIPLQIYPTSASLSARALADSIARSRGFHSALMVGDEGELYCEATNPLAIVQGRKLLLAPIPYSPEGELIERAAQSAGIEVERRTLYREDVVQADEVMSIGWQGITAAQHIDGKLYMAIIAERLAAEMERISGR